MGVKSLVLIAFFLSATSTIYAATTTTTLSVGNYVPTTLVQDETGQRKTFQNNPYIGIGTIVQIKAQHYFSPLLGLAFHTEMDDSYGDYSKKTFFLLWDFSSLVVPHIAIRYGIGTFYTRIGGDGAQITVPNGASGTSTAYQPSKTVTSYSTTLNLGVEYITPRISNLVFSFRGEGHLFSFLSSERRTLGYTLSINTFF